MKSTRSETAISRFLVDRGTRLFKAPRQFVRFTESQQADELLNDISKHPHAFVLGCAMDRQMKAERAWIIPYKISKKIGSFEFSALLKLKQERIERLMAKPEPLHRFPQEMSKNFFAAIQLIWAKYEGDAAKIWRDRPSSADLVYRFLEFRGIGPKIGTMAANILARDFKVPLRDYYSIDVSVDVQVRRVLSRLGLIAPDDPIDRIIYRARALHPDFPGLIDFPAWELGRKWCRPTRPLCNECYMSRVCPGRVEQKPDRRCREPGQGRGREERAGKGRGRDELLPVDLK